MPVCCKTLREGSDQWHRRYTRHRGRQRPARSAPRGISACRPRCPYRSRRTGDGHARDGSARRKVQALLGEPLPGAGDALGFPGGNKGQLDHGVIFPVGTDISRRVIRAGDLLGNQGLKVRLAAKDRLNGALNQVQALAQVLNSGGRHLPGYFPRHHGNNCPEDGEK